jgi:hypothetical protein
MGDLWHGGLKTERYPLGSIPSRSTNFERRVDPRKYIPNPNLTLDDCKLDSVNEVQGYVVHKFLIGM